MPEAKRTEVLPVEPPTPSQEEANEIKSQVILGKDAKAEDDELPPPVVHDPPAPSQDEANEAKVQSALGGMDITAPVNVDVPHLQPGSAVVGDTLTITMGNWDMQPSQYAGEWFRDGTEAIGSGASYVVSEADAGHSITCVVTASNAIGSTVAPPSNAVAIPASRRAESAGAGPAASTREGQHQAPEPHHPAPTKK
jgi:hypothetical protein